MPQVIFPDGRTERVEVGTPLDRILPADAVCGRVAGSLVDRSWPVEGDVSVEVVGPSDPDGLHVLRHSAAHVLAQAVCDLYPGAKYAIGPPIADGFYYYFDFPSPPALEVL